jgi:hypothetical protein
MRNRIFRALCPFSHAWHVISRDGRTTKIYKYIYNAGSEVASYRLCGARSGSPQ